MSNNSSYAFNLNAACLEVLFIAFTKTDSRNFDKYFLSLRTDEAIDKERSFHASAVDQVFNDFKNCSNVYQIRRLIKDQPLSIKVFVFERLVITSQMCLDIGINEIKSPSPDYGAAFSETIQTLWSRFLATFQEKGDSVSEYYRYILERNPQKL